MKVLMVAEKPSIASDIANALCTSGSPEMLRRALPQYHFRGRFPPTGQNAEFTVTSVAGHVFNSDFTSAMNNWDKVAERDLFDAPTVKQPCDSKIVKHLESCAHGCDYLVLWLDCDREGENICFEVMSVVRSSIHRNENIYRAKFSALTRSELTQAFNKLGRPDRNLSDAVEARAELDLKLGCAFTRFMTKSFHQKFGNLDSATVSAGPVQTPALGFCVKRHDEIVNFKPENYWSLQPHLGGATAAKSLKFDWQRGRVFDETMARLLLTKVTSESKTGKILSISMSNDLKPRPVGLNTVELLRVMSRVGMGSQQTMNAAEHLYLRGYLSYPRTETTAYPSSFNFHEIVQDLTKSNTYGQYARDLLAQGINRSRSGKDCGDHPPITVMKLASAADLGGSDAQRVYAYVVQHFLASISPDCKYKKTTIKVDLHGEIFTAQGRIVEQAGWTEIMTHAALDDCSIPQSILSSGSGSPITFSDIKLHSSQTSAPAYLSEADLLTLMESNNIGTDASMPGAIQLLLNRNYVNVTGTSRKMEPTQLGIILARGLSAIDPELVLPLVRSEVEKMLTMIAEGKATRETVVRNSLQLFTKKFDYFVSQIEKMYTLMEAVYSPLSATGKPLTKCGVCSRYMKFIDTKPCRLFCNFCQVQYSLPSNGTIKKYFEFKCPIDNFELVVNHVQNGNSTPLCPRCWNEPPFEDYGKKAMTCSACMHPTCRESLAQTYVADCYDESCRGALALVLRKQPWMACCNKCTNQIKLPAAAKRVKVLPTECEDCGAHEIKLEFESAEKSTIPGRPLEISGCVFCDPKLSGACEMARGRAFSSSRGGRGGNRGRGRGGGRGRGEGRGGGRGRGKFRD